jgi:hypothetical protein
MLIRKFRGLVAAIALGLASGAPMADVLPVTPGNASAIVGSTVQPTFNIGFASGYDLIGLDFTLTYSNALSFSKLELTLPSTAGAVGVVVNSGDLTGIPPVFSGSAGDFSYSGSLTVPISGSSELTFSGFPSSSSVVLSGPVLLKATFLTSTIGQSAVALAGTSAPNTPPFDTLDTFSSSALVTVSAVPEPEAWLMLLAGLGMLATLGRRRSVARR